MKRRPKSPSTEQAISDGQRHLGRISPSGDAFKAYDAAGKLLCEVGTISEARAAVLRNDRGAAA